MKPALRLWRMNMKGQIVRRSPRTPRQVDLSDLPNIHRRITYHRLRQGLSRDDLYARVNCKPVKVNGCQFNFFLLKQLARTLEVSFQQLVPKITPAVRTDEMACVWALSRGWATWDEVVAHAKRYHLSLEKIDERHQDSLNRKQRKHHATDA